jgi:hypothetical protein
MVGATTGSHNYLGTCVEQGPTRDGIRMWMGEQITQKYKNTQEHQETRVATLTCCDQCSCVLWVALDDLEGLCVCDEFVGLR